MCIVSGRPMSSAAVPEGLVEGVGVGLVDRRGAGDRDTLDAHLRAALQLRDGHVDVAQGEAADADQPLRRVRAVVADPVVVALEDGVDDLDVVDHEGEHVDRGVHDLADDAVLILLLEPRHGVLDAGIDQVPAARDLLLGLGQVEVRAGDPEPADGHREVDARPGDEDGVAVLPLVDHAWRPVAKPVDQSVEYLWPLNDVGIARVVDVGHDFVLPRGLLATR